MNVLILHDTVNFAGTESHIMTLATGLSTIDGVNVELLVPEDSELHKRCVAASIGHHISLPNYVDFFLQTFKTARKFRPQVLHAHNGRTTIIAVVVSKLLKCKVVATQHFLEPAHVSDSGIKLKLKRAVHQWIGKQLDYRICVSEATLQCMKQRGDIIAKSADRVRVVYSGISMRKSDRETRELCKAAVLSELELPKNSQIIFTASRLEREKSVDVFLRAVIPICLKFPAMHAVIAGEGTESDKLRSIAQEFSVTRQIHFLGFRSDVERLMLAADIFVLSSAIESFGMVLLEAMVCRTPAIAPDCGGPKEIIHDRDSGLLYSPSDVDDLTSAITELVETPSLRDLMAECGYSRVTEVFSVRRMAQDTLYAYSVATSGASNA